MFKNLNTIQKVCVMVGVLSFTFWLSEPTGYEYRELTEIFEKFEEWFRYRYNAFSFAIAVTSAVGFFLFKDKK